MVGVRWEACWKERLLQLLLLLLLLLERGGGQVGQVLELLRLAEDLHREEWISRRRRGHGVGGGKTGAGRREGAVVQLLVHGKGVERRRAGVAGSRVVGLSGVGAGRLEGPHGDLGEREEEEEAGRRVGRDSEIGRAHV